MLQCKEEALLDDGSSSRSRSAPPPQLALWTPPWLAGSWLLLLLQPPSEFGEVGER